MVDLAAILVSKADYLISEPYLLLKAHNDGPPHHEWQTILHGPSEVFLELVSGLIEVVLEFVAPVLYELDTTRLAKLQVLLNVAEKLQSIIFERLGQVVFAIEVIHVSKSAITEFHGDEEPEEIYEGLAEGLEVNQLLVVLSYMSS